MNLAVFKTLMLREWMQHRRGWLILAVLPFAVMLLVVSFGSINLGDDMKLGADSMATPLAGMLGVASLATTLTLMWLAVMLQAPGLARRDVQDRSIEFWLSLPTPPAASIGSTLLTHLVLVPWFAIAAGLVAGALIAPVVVLKVFGFSALGSVEWGLLGAASLALAVRLAAGVVIFTLWMSPLLLGVMAAAAWLKRWGVPAVAGALAVGGGLEKLVLGSDVIYRTIAWLFNHAAVGLFGASKVGGEDNAPHINHPSELAAILPDAVGWIMGDLIAALRGMATPGFAIVLAVAAGLFWLLVMRRSRGA